MGRLSHPFLGVYNIPRTSLTHAQPPSPAKSFLANTESLASPCSKGNTHLSAQTVLSKTQCCLSSPHCTSEMTSSIS